MKQTEIKAAATASLNAEYDQAIEDDDWNECVNMVRGGGVKRKRGRGRSTGTNKRFKQTGSNRAKTRYILIEK